MPTLNRVQEPFRGLLLAEDEWGRPIDMGDDPMHGANLGGSITMWSGASHGISHDAACKNCGIYTSGRLYERGKVGREYSIHNVVT